MTYMKADRFEVATKFLEQLRVAISGRDVEDILKLMTDDIVYDDLGSDKATRGRSELANLFEPLFASMKSLDLRLTGVYLGVDETIGARWRYTALRKGDKEPIVFETASFYTMRDGKACEITVFFRHTDWLGDIWP
ncbi:MAG: nuclear transport factor 2 family protein [bacterium]|nr:nuclear transport factor 2 family protein [bacterium]